MGDFSGTRQADYVLPPRQGQQCLLSTSNTAATKNLALVGPQTAGMDTSPGMASSSQGQGIGAVGKYIRVSAITADVYVAFGSSSAAVANVTATTTGTNQANTAAPIFAGTYQDFRLETNDHWMGYVTASGSGYVHIYINSRGA